VITLEEIRKKYPNANYAPNPDCERCNGTGERWVDMNTEFVKPHMTPCICTFIAPESVEFVAGAIKKIAQDYLGAGEAQ
jgi:hypothetical protein